MAEMFRADGDSLFHSGEAPPSMTAVSSSCFVTVGTRVLSGRLFPPNAGRGGPIVRAGEAQVGDVARVARHMADKAPDGSEGQVVVLSEFLAPQLDAWRLGA